MHSQAGETSPACSGVLPSPDRPLASYLCRPALSDSPSLGIAQPALPCLLPSWHTVPCRAQAGGSSVRVPLGWAPVPASRPWLWQQPGQHRAATGKKPPPSIAPASWSRDMDRCALFSEPAGVWR